MSFLPLDLGMVVILASFNSEGICSESTLSLNSFARLQEIESATIRRSPAEILSGPVALPVSKDVQTSSGHPPSSAQRNDNWWRWKMR